MVFDILEFPVLNQMFNETRQSQTFTFPIFVDDVPEGVEELQLTLSLRAGDQLPEGAVNVTPAVATVRIHDLSSKFIEQFCHGFSTNKAVFNKTDDEYTTRDRGQRKFAADIPRAKGEGYIYCKLPMTEVKGSMIRRIHHLTMVHIIFTIVHRQIYVSGFCFRYYIFEWFMLGTYYIFEWFMLDT